MKNIINNNTGLLLRMDDIAENMNWNFMDDCEKVFDEINVRPLIGIIPENKDPELLKYPKNSNFWERVRSWEKKGWEISLHGFNHVYDSDTKYNDYFNYGGGSEFYGHSYDHQFNKIKLGKEKLKSENIKNVNSFFAPNHTYDSNTLLALSNNGIKVIIDGYGLFPYSEKNLTFSPQLFYKETMMLPFGLQSTQIHLNYWDEVYLKKFKNFLYLHQNKIKSYQETLSKKHNNKFEKLTRYLLKKTLIQIRKVKN
jgi:predicted deacetylase